MLLSIASIVSGTGLLFLNWKGKLPGTPAKLVGWLLLLVAAYLSILSWGPEFGTAYWLCFIACTAGVFVALEAEPWVPKATQARAAIQFASPPQWLKQFLLFLFIFFVGGLASMNLAILISLWLPGELVDRMAIGVILTPILWGAAMYWTTAYQRSALISLPVILLCSGLVLMVT